MHKHTLCLQSFNNTTLSIFVEQKHFVCYSSLSLSHVYMFLAFTVASYDQLSLLHFALWISRNCPFLNGTTIKLLDMKLYKFEILVRT